MILVRVVGSCALGSAEGGAIETALVVPEYKATSLLPFETISQPPEGQESRLKISTYKASLV